MAEQLEFFSIPSPCQRICQTDSKGYCIGCFRNRNERFNWLSFSEQEKHHILRLCQQRKIRRLREQLKVQSTTGDTGLPQQTSFFD